MRRILVIGSGGAGKSTFARRLGERLDLEVLHLDRLYWRAGWVETPKQEWQRTVEALTRRASWIIDGNYSGTLDLRVAACDTIVFLDLPRLVCLWGVLRRVFLGRARPDMAPGCPERLDLEFLRWVWHYPRRSRPKIVGKLQAAGAAGKHVVRLTSRAAVESFLADLA